MSFARSAIALTLGLALSLASGAPQASASEPLIPVRLAVIGSSGQGEVPQAIKKYRIDKKHGIDVQVIDFAAPGQQYTMFRSGAIDVAAGNFIDLLRQRSAGSKLKAFRGFQRYNNRIVVKADSPIKTFQDLKGKKVGQFGTTFLDWLIVRAAGKKAHDIDLQNDADLVQGAPPLLNQLLGRGELDAALQFSSLTYGPLARGEQRVVVDVPGIMSAAGLNPEAFYLQWIVSEQWLNAHSDALSRLDAVFAEAYEKLQSDDEIWEPLAKAIRITDPAVAHTYRDSARRIQNPSYNAQLIEPTQTLVDALVAIAGESAVGIKTVDPEAFAFPAAQR